MIDILKHGMTRRNFAAALGGLIGASALRLPEAAADDAGEVTILGWAAYWPPEAVALLKAKTGLTLKLVGADTDQTIFTKLKAGGGDDYDLVYADAGWVPLYKKFDLIQAIPVADVKATKNLYTEFLETASFPFIEEPGKSLLLYPNMWSPLALIWKSSLFEKNQELSWKMLWDEKVPKGTVMFAGGSGDDFLAIGGLANGVPHDQVYSMNADQLKLVVSEMRKLKPFQIVVSNEAEFRARFKRGDAAIGATPQLGTASIINNEAKTDVATAGIPKEGSIGWVDGLMMVKNTKNRANAIKLLEFIGSDLEYARIIFENTGSSPCSRAATESLVAKGGPNADMIRTIQADKPSIASQIVLEAPPEDPNAYSQAWDEVLAN